MNNIPRGEEDDDKPQGVVNMGDDYAGLEDENAQADFHEKDPDDFRDNLEDR